MTAQNIDLPQVDLTNSKTTENGPTHSASLINVRAIREGLRMTRQAFANYFGLSLRTVQAWEQRKRQPDKNSLILLALIFHHPRTVRSAVLAVERAAKGGSRPLNPLANPNDETSVESTECFDIECPDDEPPFMIHTAS